MATSFSAECEKFFSSKDLYDVLNLPKDAAERKSLSANHIKKAYHKSSLKYHPDRLKKSEQNEDATRKFQIIGKAYQILSDEEKRKVYDETGCIDDENDNGNTDWEALWRRFFKPITEEDIEQFAKEYKNSEEERSDIVTAYRKHEGDMDVIMGEIMCANVIDDEDRIEAIIRELIKKKQLPSFPAFTKQTKASKAKRKRAAEKEAKEAEEAMKEVGMKQNTSESDLAALILAKNSNRGGSFLDVLEAKYCAKPSSSKASKKKKT